MAKATKTGKSAKTSSSKTVKSVSSKSGSSKTAKSGSSKTAKVPVKTSKTVKPVSSKSGSVKAAKPSKSTSSKAVSKTATVKSGTTAKSSGRTAGKTSTNKPTAKSKSNMPSTKFHVDQKVVYPSQGVGKITDITEREFKDQKMWYYNIYIEASDMVVMVPVDRAEDLGIRAIVSSAEAEKALKLLSDDFEPITSDWKLRYQMNLDLLKKGSITDIATIVRCLYNRSKVKELPILERKLYDSARKLLEDEISFAMGKSAKEVESMIHTKLEPPGSAPKVKHVINVDNDEDDSLMDDMEDKNDDSSDEDSSDDDSSDSDDESEDDSSSSDDNGSDDDADDADDSASEDDDSF